MRKLFLGVLVLLLVLVAQACSHHHSEQTVEVHESVTTHHNTAVENLKPAGPVCDCCKKVPIHRYQSQHTGAHFYTAVPEEIGTTVKGAVGLYHYKYHGIVFYACQ
jgi:hypothetical protein